MKRLAIAWYLFGLMAVAALLESATTYAPTAQQMGNVILCVTVLLSAVFGLGATWLTLQRKKNPDNQIFHSKSALFVVMSVAVIMTLVVLFAVVG
jgi:uncharacterized membrane protein